MFTTKTLYSGAALYASTSAFMAAWICLALPVRHNTVGPYNYHRVLKAGRRVPWRRLPKVL